MTVREAVEHLAYGEDFYLEGAHSGKILYHSRRNKSELQKFPIRLDHYDKEHGDEHFVYGIESLMEYAECLPVIVPAEREGEDATD